ncbi:MAG: UvrD-helicase domain-containing protein [Mediterranea sp.]|jgi:DNA helicase-2/ATP-dependent DNA helicase PcrA|nr:UvrD-helicase domain-containing protein [Mediterranea sp.]
MNTHYLDELNEEQRAAVLYNDGPSLIVAGAGSGKTRVLTYKIAYLLENGYQPWNILALTFTNKAAREMKSRIARQVGSESARRLWMGTFHSIFLRILHVEADRLGFTPHFTVYDTADSKSLIRSIIKEMKLDDKLYKPGVVQARISHAKNQLISPAKYASDPQLYDYDQSCRMPSIRDIYRRYMDRCRQADAMDFDDLLYYTYVLFRDHADVLAHYAEQFRYILVDEYQDTNFAQHSIVLQLASRHQHVCVVGDDAQSIYSFRGADIGNILYFTKVYPDARLFKLERNYRSTQNIVSAANSLIAKNRMQIPKEVFSKKEEGEAVTVLQAYSDTEEAEIVANEIRKLHRNEHCEYSDFAVLYRTNAQSRILEEVMRKRGMPYRIYGGLSFYQRKEIKDVIAYFRLTVNPNDEEAFKRVINYPARGIGDTTVGKLTAAATEHGASLWKVMSNPSDYGVNINKGTQGKLQLFRDLINGFMSDLAEKNAYEKGKEIIRQSGIINDIYQDKSPENLSRQENVEELVNSLSNFCEERMEEGNTHIALPDFLSEVSLLTDQDSDKTSDEPRVTLMTAHAAKGLEFANVFVVGLEEGLFPSNMAGDVPRAVEEERRLFYVAITRAEKRCYLLYARSRSRYGSTDFCTPSRFLRDIDTQYLHLPAQMKAAQRIDSEAETFRAEAPRQSFHTPVPSPRLKRVVSTSTDAPAVASGGTAAPAVDVGQRIEHERFGVGEVLRVEGAGDNAKATIRFENAGEKQLLLRYARFTVIN